MVADGLNDVGALGQQIFGDCPGKQRVILKDGQAVADTVADAAFSVLSSMALTSSTLRGGGASCMVCSAACRISGGKLCHSSFKIAHFLSTVDDKSYPFLHIRGEQHIQQIVHIVLLLQGFHKQRVESSSGVLGA